MTKMKFCGEKIVRFLQEAAVGQSSQPKLGRKHGFSPNTIYIWKRRNAGMETDDGRRLKEL